MIYVKFTFGNDNIFDSEIKYASYPNGVPMATLDNDVMELAIEFTENHEEDFIKMYDEDGDESLEHFLDMCDCDTWWDWEEVSEEEYLKETMGE
ncbi:MAG: hypothetical protein NC548_22840 [Lachnospiraceae bacterium]|nr:hypothetical protein [Lachnospiraceae bacterium]